MPLTRQKRARLCEHYEMNGCLVLPTPEKEIYADLDNLDLRSIRVSSSLLGSESLEENRLMREAAGLHIGSCRIIGLRSTIDPFVLFLLP